MICVGGDVKHCSFIHSFILSLMSGVDTHQVHHNTCEISLGLKLTKFRSNSIAEATSQCYWSHACTELN